MLHFAVNTERAEEVTQLTTPKEPFRLGYVSFEILDLGTYLFDLYSSLHSSLGKLVFVGSSCTFVYETRTLLIFIIIGLI